MEKREGFKGQRSVVLPDFIIKEFKNDVLSKQLFITDIGYYPNAKHHERKREKGSKQYILIYCTQGKGWISINGKRTEIGPNHFCIIPKSVAHSYGSNHSNPWSIYWIHFSGILAPYFYQTERYANVTLPLKVEHTDEREHLFSEMLQNLEMGYSKENLQYANICLFHFLASFKYMNQFQQTKLIRETNTIENAIFFMKENIDKKLTLENMAQVVGLSSSHFSFQFRKETGRSPMDYLIHLRIQKACHYLDNSGLRISEICTKIGYDDPFYFSRIFKKTMGVSPLIYRKKLKG